MGFVKEVRERAGDKWSDRLSTFGLLLGIALTVYMVAWLFMPPGWEENVDCVSYRAQFKPVIKELIECSKTGQVLQAWMVGADVYVNCVNRPLGLLPGEWNYSTRMG